MSAVLTRGQRFVSGLWHVPSGFLYLLKRPSLWPLSLLPAIATLLLVTAGLAAGYALGPALSSRIVDPGAAGAELLRLGVQLAALVAGAVAGLGIVLLLTAPLQELLSRKVERQLLGRTGEAGRGLSWEIAQTLRGALYFLLRAPFMLAVGLIPLVGPPVALLWAAHSLALQQTDATLARHGLDFRDRRLWHRRHRFESLGFGLAGLLALLVPVVNLLLIPALVIGATRLALARLP